MTTDVRTTDFVKLGASLLDVLGGIRRRVRKLRPDQGLLASQAEVLRLVVDDPGLSVASLAEVLHVAPNTVSTLLRQLVDHGLIVRYRDGSDRRVARFEPTDAARERLSVNRDRRAAAVSAALHQLPESDREAIANAVPALQRLTEMLS